MPPDAEIQLCCHRCGSKKMVPRLPADPPNAVRVYTFCPACVSGGYDDTHYFDKQERELYGDPLSKNWGKPLEELRNAPCSGK